MVAIVWALIALSLGLLTYLTTAIIAPILPHDLQLAVARYHSNLAMRAYRQTAIVRRLFGTYELYPLATNDEEKLAQVTLDSGLIGDDEKLEFADPDDRLSRLHQKPFTLVSEAIPAAVDAELAELGHWVHEHELDTGLTDGDRVNPWVPMADTLRVVDPADVMHMVSKSIEPETIKTARVITEDRYSKYGTDIGLAETLGTLTGFAVGLGGVAFAQYVRNNLLDSGGSGGGTTIPMSPTILPPDPIFLHAPELVVMLT